jgi:threonine dehydratase
VALEMLEDVPDLEVLPIPIGGGGLISGMATAAKH